MKPNIDNIHQYLTWLFNSILAYLPQLMIALIILVIGWFASKLIRRTVKKLFNKTKLDQAVSLLLTQIIYVSLIIFSILMAISELGISTTPISSAIIGIMVGIGMSLKSSLNLVTSGIIVASSRPFKIGEYVDIGGTSGTIENMNFVYCTLRTSDGREIKMPNSLITSRVITNFSNNEFRRNDFLVGISYDSNLREAKDILQTIIDESDLIIKSEDQAPIIKVNELQESAVSLLVRYWTKRSDFREANWQLVEKTKLLFDQYGIEIPFPQRKIHFSSINDIKLNQNIKKNEAELVCS